MDVLDEVERQLLSAIREHLGDQRARRRRRLSALAVAGTVLVAVSGASAISGEGPIADVLGVERDDPALRSVREVRGAPRAVVKVRGDDGHLYTFAGFHARQAIGRPSGRSLCSTETRDDNKRIPSIGCGPPVLLAKALRRDGMIGWPSWGSSQAGGLRLTATASGFVPADVRSVTFSREGEPPVEATLSKPIPVSLRAPTKRPQTRAFLAVASYDNDGADWLHPPVRRTIIVVLADGTVKRHVFPEPQFFPMVAASRPQGPQIHMGHAGYPTAWRSVGYRGERGTLCNAAAPVGERLITLSKLQCSSPLAIVNALTRYGASLNLSNFNPRRERGRRSVAVFGFTRADARAVTIIDSRGRRYDANLSRPWETAARGRGDLNGLDGELRRRLEMLPRRLAVRSYITSLDVPPEPGDRGVRLLVELDDGRVLRTGSG